MAGAPSPAEKKRQELIITIQKLHKSGETIKDIAHITGKDWKTVKRYLDGDPRLLCRYDRHSTLDIYSGYIINSIKAGQTASAIARKIKEKGNKSTLTNIRMFVAKLAKEHGLEITKYHCSPSRCDQGGNPLPKMDFITRKGIFNHLWMNMDLTLGHRNYLWMHHESLPQLDKCIREFREIFTKKSIPRLHLFIERYSQSPLKEIASFANGLKKDIEAVENAKTQNDARYKEITTSVDLNQIKDIAINQLGMKYASQDQIVYYTVENNNYMDQYSNIPE